MPLRVCQSLVRRKDALRQTSSNPETKTQQGASPALQWHRSQQIQQGAGVSARQNSSDFERPKKGKNTQIPILKCLISCHCSIRSTLCSNSDDIRAVSYTHLRAHETRHDLVCRLLLEKKKKKIHQ